MPNPVLLETPADQDEVQEAKNTIAYLRFQLKKVENNRKSNRTKLQLLLQKQCEIIENLEKEISEMQKNVHLLRSESLAIQDHKYSNQLKKLLDIQDQYRLEIDNSKLKLKELNGRVFVAHKKHLEIQKKIDVSNDKYKVMKNQKKIELLDSRLNHAIIKYDHFRRRNSIFRGQIDVMLNVRSMFYQNYTNIKQLITQGKQTAKEIIHSTSLSYKTREELKYRTGVLQKRAEFDRKKVIEEMKALRRILEHDKQLCAFLKKRNKERQSATSKKTRENPLRDIKQQEEKVQTCASVFEEISTVASTKDIAIMIENFQKAEDDNFTKFGMVNELNSEIENLRHAIQNLQINISDGESKLSFHQKKAAYEKGNVKNILENLEHDVQDLQRSASENSTILENTKDFTRKLYEKTERIFPPELEIWGSDDITNLDAMKFIEILEIRIVDLLNCYKYLQYKLHQDESDDIPLSFAQKNMPMAIATSASNTLLQATKNSILPPKDMDKEMNIQLTYNLHKEIYNEEKLKDIANISLQKRQAEK